MRKAFLLIVGEVDAPTPTTAITRRHLLTIPGQRNLAVLDVVEDRTRFRGAALEGRRHLLFFSRLGVHRSRLGARGSRNRFPGRWGLRGTPFRLPYRRRRLDA